MIPVPASMVVQVVEIKVPYVWSADLDAGLSVVMRKIEVTHTLHGEIG